MRNNVNSQARRFLKNRKFLRRWKRGVTCLAAVVVFFTTYALILPAITLTDAPICGYTEHVHDLSCYQTSESAVSCPLAVHKHDDSCYNSDNALICGYGELVVHQHTEICYNGDGTLSCGIQEVYAHIHDENCCELVEMETADSEAAQPEYKLICEKVEIIPHTHGDGCFGAEGELICGMAQVQEHVHTGDCCAVLACGLEEHKHDEVLCFSDPNADVESPDEWTKALPELTGQYTADLLAVARSQIGYTQSSTNVKADAEGRLQYYTRYGAWYGQPYDDWDAMFVSFCLHYAQIPQTEFPIESNSYRWTMELRSHDDVLLKQAQENQETAPVLLYAAASDHEPVPGNLVFFDLDADGNADRMGIVAELLEESIRTIEGDTVNGCVEYQTYGAGAPAILGYGIIPEAETGTADPVQITLTAETGTVTAAAVFAEGVLPPDATMTVTQLPSTEENLTAMESTLEDCSVEAVYRFDITFTDAEGNELEPNGNVTVSIQFAEPLSAAAELDQLAAGREAPVEWKLLHIPAEGDTENLTDQQFTVLQTAGDASLEAVQFESDGFSEYVLLAVTPKARAAEISLADYLANNGGTIKYNLYDEDGNLLVSDNGLIDVVIGEKYSLTFVVEAPNGIHPDDYFLQLPDGVKTGEKSGTLVTDGEEIGTWEVNTNGMITLHFNEEADSHQNILFSGQIEVIFEEVDETIEIEGDVIVNPKPPEDETGYMWKSFYYGYLYDKNGIVTDENGNQIPTSINWRITVYGSNGDMPVVGQTITDQLGNNGLQIYDPEEEPVTLEITLPNGEKHGDIIISTEENIRAGIFKWIEDANGNYVGWEYTVPETIACTGNECAEENREYCQGDGSVTLALEDEDWQYYFRCESFPKDSGNFDPNGNYTNTVFKSDNPNMKYSENTGLQEGPGVIKDASYDAVRDNYSFDATITIPGGMFGSHFAIKDDMTILDADGADYVKVENTIKELNSVTMYLGDDVYTIPFINLCTEENPGTARANWFKSHQRYSATPYVLLADYCEKTTVDGEEVIYEYEYEFWKWCDCTDETCPYGDCSEAEQIRDGFCRCWNIDEDVTIRFSYSTPAGPLNSLYGGQGMELENDLELGWRIIDPDTHNYATEKAEDKPTVDIPGIISKTEQAQALEDNEYTAIFGITLNQMLQDWSLLEEVVIHDEMSKSLVYIPGTLEVTRDDNTTPLVIGEDYTLTAVEGGHGFVVTLLDPQQSMYHMQYSAMVVQEGIDINNPSYNNKAWVTVDDTRYNSGEINTNLTEFTFASKSYAVTVYKVDQNKQPLNGVTFGLFAENGELIQQKTVENGSVTFITSVTDGIIFQTHSKYYIQELEPKPGYTPDYTKYMFYFCEQEPCTEETPGVIHFGDKGELTIENKLGGYELPNTGGIGTAVYTIGGLSLMLLAAYLLLNKKKYHWKEGNRYR